MGAHCKQLCAIFCDETLSPPERGAHNSEEKSTRRASRHIGYRDPDESGAFPAPTCMLPPARRRSP
jgi:hypothetical protein